MGLPYPGGPVIDRLAKEGDPKAFSFSKPHVKGEFDYSFSGLKTSFLYTLRDKVAEDPDFVEKNKADLCASLQHTIIEILLDKLIKATKALGIQFDLDGILKFFVDHETNHGAQRSVAKNSYQVILDECRINATSFYRQGEEDPRNKAFGRISYPKTILPNGKCVVEEYEIRRGFLEEILSKKNFPNITTCAREWKAMEVLDHETGRLTRSRKIDKKSGKAEDVFVFRVFGDAPDSQPKSKLVKRSLLKPSPQLAAMLNETEEEDDDD
jgi:hypothetical protein